MNQKCMACHHFHDVSDETKVCTLAGCRCDYERFVPEIETKSVEYYNQVMQKYTDMEERIKYLLVEIPGFRNLNDKQFTMAYYHYVHGFCPGMILTVQKYHEIPEGGLVTRARRRVCQYNEDLRGDEKRLKFTDIEQTAIMEWAVGT